MQVRPRWVKYTQPPAGDLAKDFPLVKAPADGFHPLAGASLTLTMPPSRYGLGDGVG